MADHARTAEDRIAALEVEVEALKRAVRGNRKKAARRQATVARRALATVVHEPTELERAMARKILRRLGR